MFNPLHEFLVNVNKYQNHAAYHKLKNADITLVVFYIFLYINTYVVLYNDAQDVKQISWQRDLNTAHTTFFKRPNIEKRI